jgi:hypothetical protein
MRLGGSRKGSTSPKHLADGIAEFWAWWVTARPEIEAAIAAKYQAVALEARRRAAEAGFDDQRRFDRTPYPTAAGSEELRVRCVEWPVPQPVAIVAWTVDRAATALGHRTEQFTDLAGARDVVALLAEEGSR